MSYRDLVIPLKKWDNHGNVVCCQLSRNTGSLCTVGTSEGVLHLWKVADKNEARPSCLGTVQAFSSAKVDACSFDTSEGRVIVGSSSGTVKVVDGACERVVETFAAAHRTSVSSIVCHPVENNFMATGSLDATVKYWDTRVSQPVNVLKGAHSAITKMAIPPDARWIASGDEGGKINFIDMRKWKSMSSFACDGAISCLRLHPLELLLAGGTRSGSIHLYDVGHPSSSLGTATHSQVNPVWSVDLVPAGNTDYMISTSSEGLRVHKGTALLANYDLPWEGMVVDSTFAESEQKLLQTVVRKSEVTIWSVDVKKLGKAAPPAQQHHQQHHHQQQQQQAPASSAFPRKPSSGQLQVLPSSSPQLRAALVRNTSLANEPLISAEPRAPLDLDFAKWRSTQTPSATVVNEEIRKTIRTGDKMGKLLEARVEAVKIVRSLWTSGDKVASIKHAERAGQADIGVVTDLLGVIVSVQKYKESLGQEHCDALLPAVHLVLTRGTDSARMIALSCTRFLCNKFLTLLHRTVSHQAIGVDLAAQERVKRSHDSIQCFVLLKAPLKDIAAASGTEQASEEALSALREIDALT